MPAGASARPSRAAVPASAWWSRSTNSAPSSTIAPPASSRERTRPPTRSRASSTTGSAPPPARAAAAASPAKPAPTTQTRTAGAQPGRAGVGIMAGMMAPAVPLLLACAILLVASATQALTGFGFSLVGVPLLAALTAPRTAVVGTSLAGPLLALATAVRDRGHVRWRTVALLVGATVLGMPVGILVLATTPQRALTALIGLVALACTLLVWRGLRLRGGAGP